jgi:prepilin-type N-terminal cleavage/methylation domain-containing protein
MKNKQGFTLIELLVVISVISLLASVMLVALNNTRAKARDARRRADLAQMAKALEFYYDKYGTYRLSGYGWSGTGQGWFGVDGAPHTVAQGLVDEGFLSNPSVDDPDLSKRPGYMIYVCNNDQTYSLSATLENPTAGDISHIQGTCNGIGGNGTYTTYGKNFALP